MVRALMIQGAGSNVGKSMLVAGLARAYARRGLRVMPFKPQNMSNNAAVTADGGEIGRAQALQARAAGQVPITDMNPVLLKPESETGVQVVVQGRALSHVEAVDYARAKPRLMQAVQDSFARLCQAADLVLVEGAGSPAEINLRAGDIANMGFARAAQVPVILAGDIDRGGVIAQMVGTQSVLDPADAAMIKGFIINKFRGDLRLFDDGLREIKTRCGWRSAGVVPWFEDAWRLPAEDVLDLASGGTGPVRIAVPQLGRIANFDDLDPLCAEPALSVEIIAPGRPLPGNADLVLIPGSKSTIADLAQFRSEGWDIDLQAHLRRGGHVLGICGGYQMLGQQVTDPDGREGPVRHAKGLGLLDVTTIMGAEKRLSRTRAHHPETGTMLDGYEIHLGQTHGPDCARAWLRLNDRPDGAMSADGRVMGCYLHGLFGADAFRAWYLARLGAASDLAHDAMIDRTLDALADHLETYLDTELLLALAARPAC